MKNEKLVEATMRALRGKLDEVYIKQYVETFDELYDSSWGPAIEVLDKIAENDLEDALMDWLEDLGTEDTPIDRTALNDYIIFQSEDIYDALGLDENGDPLNEGKKVTERMEIHTEYNVCADEDSEDLIETFFDKQEAIDFAEKTPRAKIVQAVEVEMDEDEDELGEVIPTDIVWRRENESKKYEDIEFYNNIKNKQEARSHKEDNERVAPRDRTQNWQGGVNKLSNKAVGMAIGDKDRVATGKGVVQVGKDRGAVIDRDIKRNRVRGAEQALNRKNAGDLDFAGTSDLQNYEVSPNQKSREYRKAHGMITRENKKIKEEKLGRNRAVKKTEGLYKLGHTMGICPNCGEAITDYGEITWLDYNADNGAMSQTFKCHNCNHTGDEIFNTSYSQTELNANAGEKYQEN